MVAARVVDLFSGCGGFSLGARLAGVKVVAAYDNDPVLVSSYSTNFPDTQLHIRDVAELNGEEVLSSVKGVDGIIGGPPCQGFSAIGRRIPGDPRRQLLSHFFRIVREVGPTFFVMENVCGLAFADARGELDAALGLVEDEYNILGPAIWNAAEFGAATTRARLFVIGTHKDGGDAMVREDLNAEKSTKTTVRATIAELEGAVRIDDRNGFDTWRITRSVVKHGYAPGMRAPDNCFTGHLTTKHSSEVVKRFSQVPEGGVDTVGRHRRLSWLGQCPALRAGTGPDRGSYQSVRPIHPQYHRVITVREAARLQGFPDGHLFHPTVWHSFRMIGNSVSPFMAKAIFRAVLARLKVHLVDAVAVG